jgi:hypothetical protein
MRDQLCFVQFLHPGGEHRPPPGGVMPWNERDHKRKFMRAVGTATDLEDTIEDELVFWGEWEPQSRILETYPNPPPEHPRWLQDPYWEPVTPPRWVQNTDPFVFGDQFHYTGCQQDRMIGGRRRPTQLRHLSRGSVILFGSCRRDRFVLDTVFVVDRYVDHGLANRDAALADISDTYRNVVIEPWYFNPPYPYQSFRLYSGATPANAVNGMFSFVPCALRSEARRGFARPVIDLPEAITNTHKQSFRLNPQASVADSARLWRSVVEQVLRSELVLGTRFALPPRA